MAELRRRQQGGTGGEPTADCDASVAVPTLVATAVDELLQQREKTQAQPESAPLLDSLHLSDSATADSSDHVSEASVWKNRTSAHRKLIDLCACVVFTLHRVGGVERFTFPLEMTAHNETWWLLIFQNAPIPVRENIPEHTHYSRMRATENMHVWQHMRVRIRRFAAMANTRPVRL